LNNRRTQFLVDLTALELDGEIDAILNQAETDFKRRVLNGEPPARVRRGLIADAKQFSSPNYTGNFVGIKKKIHRMIADQEQRMVAKPVEDFKGERGQLYLWVRDPHASGCGDCLRHGKMPPRTKEGWLQLGRGLPRWGDTECNIGCKCMLRPVKRGGRVSETSNKLWRAKRAGTQAQEIIGVHDIRMQKAIHQQAKVAPRSTTYVDVHARVIAMAQRDFKAEMTAEQSALEAPLTEGPKVRGKSKAGKSHSKDRKDLEGSKIKKESALNATSHVNEAWLLENGVKGVFKAHETEYGMPKGRKGKVGRQLRDGVKTGNQYKREVAMSIIDEEMGLGLVPTTVMRKHKGKIGSFQKFKNKYTDVDKMERDLYNLGHKGTWKTLVSDRSKEGWYLLDSIAQQSDRHDGNWMARIVKKQGKVKTYPKREAKKEFEKLKNEVAMHESQIRTYDDSIKHKKREIKEAQAKSKTLEVGEHDWRYNERRIDSLKGSLRASEKSLNIAKSQRIEAVENRELAEQKWITAPSSKMIAKDILTVRVALIDNGLALPQGHGPTGNGTKLSYEFKGKKVSTYWMSKLRKMKGNEDQVRMRMKQESGLSNIAIDTFFRRLDRVLDTGVHLDGNYQAGRARKDDLWQGENLKFIRGSAL